MTILNLRAPQIPIRDFIIDTPRCNVLASMGIGKTSATLSAIDLIVLCGWSDRVLILGPKRVARGTWTEEVAKWAGTFGHLDIAVAIGTEKERIDALRRRTRIVAINYDNLPWLVEVMGSSWDFDTVVADESTMLKGLRVSLQTSKLGKKHTRGQGSTRAAAVAKVAHTKVKRWINLTGSFAPNGLIDVWGQQWFVDGGARLGSTFDAYQSRWFRSVSTSDYGTIVEPLEFAKPQIEDAIRDVTISINAKDYFDIREPVEHIVRVRLPPAARKQYLTMEREFFAEIGNFDVEAFNSGGKSSKCAQIANGAVYVDREGTWETVHDEKLDALHSIVNESGGAPILLRYCFKPDLWRILKAFPQAKLLDDKAQTLTDFKRGRIPMLCTHAKSAGHGLSLQDNCWTLVDYSIDFNLEHDEQVLERVGPLRQMQSGFTDRVVRRYRIIAEDTIEENSMLPRIRTKASVKESLLEAMKRRV